MENGDIEMDIKWDNVIYLQQEINEYCSIKRLLSIYIYYTKATFI